jgi:hypothetical protein
MLLYTFIYWECKKLIKILNLLKIFLFLVLNLDYVETIEKKVEISNIITEKIIMMNDKEEDIVVLNTVESNNKSATDSFFNEPIISIENGNLKKTIEPIKEYTPIKKPKGKKSFKKGRKNKALDFNDQISNNLLDEEQLESIFNNKI